MENQSLSKSIPVVPDHYNGRSIRKKLVLVLLFSLFLCWLVPAALPDFVQSVSDYVWAVFHVSYLGILFVVYYRSARRIKAIEAWEG